MRETDIKGYYEIVTKMWSYFKRICADYDSEKALEGVKAFESWLKDNYPGQVDFGMELIKAAWKEAGFRHERIDKNNT